MSTSPTISRKQRALELLKSNRLEEAKSLCEEVARTENNAGAWHLLGVIHGMLGNLQEAETCSRRAIEIRPDYAEAHCNLGTTLRLQGRNDEAITSLREALRLKPDYPEAHHNLGMAFAAGSRRDEALAGFREAIRLRPDYAEAHYYLGATLAASGLFEEASTSFREVIRLQPRHPGAHALLGNAQVEQGAFEAAAENYRLALELRPDDAETLNNLGNALLELDKPQEAIDCYQRALHLQPGYFSALQNLSIAYLDAGQPEKAEACSRQALQLNPDNPETLTNLGSAMVGQNQMEEAIAHYRQALTLKPNHAAAHFNLGNALRAQGKFEDAISSYRNAIAIDADHADAHCNLSLTYLALGRFQQGWDEYQWQWRRKGAPSRLFAPSPWDGSNLDGREVFLYVEQGLGDELFFLRFVPWLRRRGAGRIAYLANPKIASLLKRASVCDDVAAPEEKPSKEHLVLAVGDLPRLLEMKHADEIPSSPRITPLPAKLAEMRARLLALGPPPYLGVTWRGGTKKKKNVLYKECPLVPLAQVLKGIPATVLVLQRELLAGEVASFEQALGRKAHDLSTLNEDMETLLALLSLIDEYVGVSNTNMHLRAGAGKTARVLVPAPPEWRWMAEGKESPWFPGFRVYRQGYDGSWEGAFDMLTAGLQQAFGRCEPMYSRQHPSPRYRELTTMYRSMHTEGEKFLGIPPEKTFPGQSLLPQAGRIKEIIMRHGAKSLLDYGAGKGMQYQPMQIIAEGVGEWPSIQAFWGVDEIYCYDPAYMPFNKLPDKKFDGVISTDVLEHCPEEDIPWILDEIFSYATRFVFANVACYPAQKRLPSGENAHCTIRPPEWWNDILRETSVRYPGVAWEVWVQYITDAAAGKQLAERRLGNSPSP